jgi:hypothetical protein
MTSCEVHIGLTYFQEVGPESPDQVFEEHTNERLHDVTEEVNHVYPRRTQYHAHTGGAGEGGGRGGEGVKS